MEIIADETPDLSVRAVSRIANIHVGRHIFIVKQFLAIPRANTDQPGVPLMENLISKAPFEEAQLHCIEIHSRIEFFLPDHRQVTRRELPEPPANGIVGHSQEADQEDQYRSDSQ